MLQKLGIISAKQLAISKQVPPLLPSRQLGSKYCVDKIPNKHVSDKKTAEEGKGGDGTGRFPSCDGGGGVLAC